MIRLTIFFLSLCLCSNGQIKTGVYTEISDTLFIGKVWILSYSQISLNNDNTFNYQHRTSEGCLLWYDINGTWLRKSGKLYLSDNVFMRDNITNDTTSGLRITVFKSQNNKLSYFNSYFDGDKAGFSPVRSIQGNFIYKEE